MKCAILPLSSRWDRSKTKETVALVASAARAIPLSHILRQKDGFLLRVFQTVLV